PYMLLLKALQETKKVAIARFVMRTKQYLATIRPIGDLLGLETMYFADEIRGAEDVGNVPEKVKVNPKELSIAEQLIDSLSAKWDPKKYRDTYRERVMELIERKARGEDVVVERREEEQPEVADLVKALRASLEASKNKRGPGAEVMIASRGDGAANANTERGNGHARAKRKSSKKKSSNGDGGLSKLTKSELLKRAADADINGRTKMSKAELVAALREVA
ncbi:MAG: Ku protein, partial [Myxococcales bacterium]